LWKQIGATSGFDVLKDKNFTTLNKFASTGKVVDVEPTSKQDIIETLRKDAALMCKHNLIDYSLFLIEADYEDEEKVRFDSKNPWKSVIKLVFNQKDKSYNF